MPGERCAPTAHQQAEAIVEKRGGSLNTERVNAAGGKFEGEWNSVQPSTNISNHARVRIGQLKTVQIFGGAIDEELDCRVTEGLDGRELDQGSRDLQRCEASDALSLGPQRLSTGREY